MKIDNNNEVISIKVEDNTKINKQVYLMSDVHFDSIACDRKTLKKHLDEAKAKDALIILGGDWFDAMQGKFDTRRSLDELRPEYRTDRYFDVVVEDSAEFLKPYAKNIVAITQGNHELKVKRYSNTDLTGRLASYLRFVGSEVVTGGWKGWIRFMLSYSTRRSTINMYYSHNASGIAVNRQAVYEPDANIIWNGHTHTAYVMPIERDRISEKGRTYHDVCWFVRTPGYKRDWDIRDGFAAQKGFGPNPIGCAIITIEYGNDDNHPRVKCNLDVL